jgi:hypothetical protein
MSDFKNNHKNTFKLLALIAVFLIAACAPDDLDFTPTPTVTPVPPTATPAPTADASVAIDLTDAETVLEAITAELPDRLPAGAIEWRIDFARGENGKEPLRNAQNGIGFKAYYTEQTGGQMNLTFAVFDSPEDAVIHYEFIKGIRSVLATGRPNADFPEPNIFGSGLYGSVGLFQLDNVFIEVNIELFSSTQGNPLVPLSREALRIYNTVLAESTGG